jgi:hypothetical protein
MEVCDLFVSINWLTATFTGFTRVFARYGHTTTGCPPLSKCLRGECRKFTLFGDTESFFHHPSSRSKIHHGGRNPWHLTRYPRGGSVVGENSVTDILN